jgi:hypothetical protein
LFEVFEQKNNIQQFFQFDCLPADKVVRYKTSLMCSTYELF